MELSVFIPFSIHKYVDALVFGGEPCNFQIEIEVKGLMIVLLSSFKQPQTNASYCRYEAEQKPLSQYKPSMVVPPQTFNYIVIIVFTTK